LNILKKPKDVYLRFDVVLKNMMMFYNLCVSLKKNRKKEKREDYC